MTAVVGSAHADTGESALRAARSAWDRHDFRGAEPRYKEALEKGSLAPADVLDAYVHLASSRLIIGKKDSALSAFRAAAVIDPKFTVPSEAGRRGAALANQARKDTGKFGALKFKATIPESSEAATAVTVDTTIDDAHLPLVRKVSVLSRDSQGGKEFARSEPPAAKISFEIPASSVPGGSTLIVRVDALDAHDNRLASIEGKVTVEAEPEAPVVAGGAPLPAAGTSKKLPADPPPLEDKSRNRGGFFSSPWPYIVGGVLLAAGGAVLYFGTRPTSDVAVGSPTVRNQ
jgi:hypothetical protein